MPRRRRSGWASFLKVHTGNSSDSDLDGRVWTPSSSPALEKTTDHRGSAGPSNTIKARVGFPLPPLPRSVQKGVAWPWTQGGCPWLYSQFLLPCMCSINIWWIHKRPHFQNCLCLCWLCLLHRLGNLSSRTPAQTNGQMLLTELQGPVISAELPWSSGPKKKCFPSANLVGVRDGRGRRGLGQTPRAMSPLLCKGPSRRFQTHSLPERQFKAGLIRSGASPGDTVTAK